MGMNYGCNKEMKHIANCPDCNKPLDSDNRCWDCNKVWSIIPKHYFRTIIKLVLYGLAIWKIIDVIKGW